MRRQTTLFLALTLALGACAGWPNSCSEVVSEFDDALERSKVASQPAVSALHLETAALIIRDQPNCFSTTQRATAEVIIRKRDREGAP